MTKKINLHWSLIKFRVNFENFVLMSFCWKVWVEWITTCEKIITGMFRLDQMKINNDSNKKTKIIKKK